MVHTLITVRVAVAYVTTLTPLGVSTVPDLIQDLPTATTRSWLLYRALLKTPKK
jgi:hypothetical protein